MRKLGLSIYLKDIKIDKEYLELGIKYGFTRLFMSLLKVDEVSDYIKLIKYAKELGYEVVVDVNQDLKISYKELGVNLLRLDEGNIDIAKDLLEINASIKQDYNGYKYACHNFYPLKYTGLNLDYFNELNKDLKKHNINIGAFVSSNENHAFGPWPINEGLCSLECHRYLPIDVQVKHLFILGIDTVIIANAYATEEELKACQEALLNPNTLHIETIENSVIENKIIDEKHYLREEKNDTVLRSTLPRLIYKKYPIYKKDYYQLYKGDVVIVNETIPHYKGELHILKKDIKNDGRYNLVGRIPKEEHLLLNECLNEIIFIRKD